MAAVPPKPVGTISGADLCQTSSEPASNEQRERAAIAATPSPPPLHWADPRACLWALCCCLLLWLLLPGGDDPEQMALEGQIAEMDTAQLNARSMRGNAGVAWRSAIKDNDARSRECTPLTLRLRFCCSLSLPSLAAACACSITTFA